MTEAELQQTLADENAPNEPQSLVGIPASTGHVTPEEARERREAMSVALSTRIPRDAIIKTFEQRYGMSADRVVVLIRSIHSMWTDEDAENKPYEKSAQRRRLHSHIRKAALAGKWGPVAQHEKILAELEGNDVPDVEAETDVDNRLSEALVHMFNLKGAGGMRILIEQQRMLIEIGGESGQPVPSKLPINTKDAIDVDG